MLTFVEAVVQAAVLSPRLPDAIGNLLRTIANGALDSARVDEGAGAHQSPGPLAPSIALVLGALVLTAAGYLALPLDPGGRRSLSHVSLTAFPLVAGVACFVAAFASARLSRVSWVLFGMAALSASAGRLLWILHDSWPGLEIPYPVGPLAFFLLFHPLFAAGALLLLRHVRFPGERAVAALDATLILSTTLVIGLRFVAEPVAGLAAVDAEWYRGSVLMQGATTLSLAVAGLLLVWRSTALPPGAVAGLVLTTVFFAVGNFLAAANRTTSTAPGESFDLIWLAGWTALLLAGLAGAAGQPAGFTGRIGRELVALLRQAVVPGTVLALGIVAIDAAFNPAMSFPTAVALGILCGLLAVRTGVALYHAELRTGAAAELAQSRALIEVSHALAGSTELDTTLRLVSEWTARLLRARAAGIELLSADGRTLEIRAISGEYQKHLGLQFPVEGSFTGSVVRAGRIRATANAAGDPEIHPEGARLLASSPLAAAPLRLRDRTLGTLFTVGEEGPFTPEQLDLLQAMAEQAAIGIQNARLFEEVRALSFTDPLTGLANRRQLDRELAREFAAAQRGRKLTAVLFDIDGFKRYNDAHGHLAGDEVLRVVGSVLRTETRAMNLAARFGGDEFVALLSGTDRAGALLFVSRVQRRFTAEVHKLTGADLEISAGLAEVCPEMQEPEDLLRAADHQLYLAKDVRMGT